MSTRDQAITISGDRFEMLGIITLPSTGQPTHPIGLLFLVGGAQYRVGSHRQFVRLARRVAEAGFPVLRFDFPGFGDSPGQPLAFNETAPHVKAAIDALERYTGIGHVVLWGLCDGASASLLYLDANCDPRVTGLSLLNPWLRSDESLARAEVKGYYRDRVLSTDFWQKFLRGGVSWRALPELLGKVWTAKRPHAVADGYAIRMARAWHTFPGKILLMLSERDLTAQAFSEHVRLDPSWQAWDRHPGMSQCGLPGADHTCSAMTDTAAMELALMNWLNQTASAMTRRQDS